MSKVPVVTWQAPDIKPVVAKDESKLFWVATRRKGKSDEWASPVVWLAQYVNKPLEYADDYEEGDEPINSYLVTECGEPFEAIGWFDIKNHAEFDNYYEQISFNERFELLGWAEYLPPQIFVTDLTIAEAFEAMEQGKTVTHAFFTSNEWMKSDGAGTMRYVFEDGVKCTKAGFLESRKGCGWLSGWHIVDEKEL
ncbi:hypothetical protein [Vibrio campbellii]|uniref:hypothetical protein n=1 Tax=Vibrio campbellii TaxID=680 RepID=UPI00210A9284|nr:hypothetical protein [Vibrio campbellii]UTZ44524.1 hypothetical protein HB764_25015 [Vibrio campbellii]